MMRTILENFILLLFIIINLDEAFSQCQPGWSRYGVSCYKFFSNQETWNNARTNCQNLGADLAVIKDVDESNFLYHSLISADIWLGLRDIGVEGEWVWIENGECTDYTNFNSGEPNNAGGDEDCVELDYSNSDRWNDLNCDTLIGYVCEMFEDTESPVFSSCPSNQLINTDVNQSYGTLTWIEPVYSDNECVISVVSDYSSGDTIPLSATGLANTITNTYTATDRAGNTGMCTFSVTVTDAESPTYVNCPSDILQETDASQNHATVTWTEPTFSDNSGIIPTIIATHTPPVVLSLNNGLQSTTNVSYVAIDASGNTNECTLNITVFDAESPKYVNCPSDILQDTDESQNYTIVAWTEPTFTDNSGILPIIIATHIPPVVLSLNSGMQSTTNVSYVGVDASGNSNECTFNITVFESTKTDCVCLSSGVGLAIGMAIVGFVIGITTTGVIFIMIGKIRAKNNKLQDYTTSIVELSEQNQRSDLQKTYDEPNLPVYANDDKTDDQNTPVYANDVKTDNDQNTPVYVNVKTKKR